VVGEKTLRGLLSLGLVVFVEGEIDRDVQEAIVANGFAVVDATLHPGVEEVVERLQTIGVLATVEGVQR